MKKPGIEPGFVCKRSISVTLVAFGQVAADGTARRAAQTSTDGGAISAAQAVTDHRTARRANTATNGRFRPAAFACGHCATGRARYTCTNRCTGATAHFLTDDITQRATQTAAQCSGAIAGSHCTLSKQKAEKQSGQC
jgi:hypothetical protein